MVTPGVIIAATSSSSGKTTIATGLMRALSQRMSVAPFKVGPDYIDPGYHGLATGYSGRNLDSVLCGSELIGGLYAHGAQDKDISVIEGVMGLFDGQISPDEHTEIARGSTAEIAALLKMPVVLVVNVRGMSQSVGALVKGFATTAAEVQIAGVILNKVGSPRHAQVCRRAVEAQGIEVLGAIPRVSGIEVPSRHLGLITAGELDSAQQAVAQMAEFVDKHIDIDRLISFANVRQDITPWQPAKVVRRQGEARIAVAAGPAFSFTYAEHYELLAAAGAEIVPFDPIVDDLPDCDGLIIPGGFPEEHAEALAQRQDLNAQVRAFVAAKKPVHAECAGLLWLLKTLAGQEMVGVIDGHGELGSRLTLGYRQAVALADSIAYVSGQRVIGHEFHHTALHNVTEINPAWGWHLWDGTATTEGFIIDNVHASYLHVHPASVPEAVERFVRSAVDNQTSTPV
ncbi:cobyrinic acid A,C-diamide synthase [Corynebacterium kutscheri]|uniref:Hydrogenobyrinate a,c-diamide synthase n=1 Tax=Corynebacterium kutscheri TaxID=35755 RepID=A0A0F6TDR1_9CORY|nr:cobyrinate a,c-diamide synthase [Corynebacterium kutscheri]AKE41451.1 cobyrinic acid a,c-diamide synthase [Corynebacterium kutscheri]VEH08729.1 cobyrinic acid A,C-diamide synthase [Corynebacterium kutscheri]VEH09775.1 cobyrinic acid A,C-diamide synthase [Corynebacterium kutscheri]VEH79858.1 cobyrinic acid A,C-diamide synthase [Corynebacterium kutscheri]